jgi:putative PIN family toxin of toxin-antitoxin system
MRAVLDTNVIISATLIRGGNEDHIIRAWQRGAFELVLSPQILEEMGRALFYEKLRRFRWMTEEETAELLQALAQGSVLVSGRGKVKASRDPEDDKFLAAAVEAEARFVVTGDRDLLGLKSYRGVRIVRPARFLKIIRRTSSRKS